MSREASQPINTCRVHNRVARVMAHVPWYGFRSQARLAADAGISEAALSRFLSGQSHPSYALVESVSRALERRLGREIPPRELVSLDGTYPTPSACELAGCRGCTPPKVYESDGFSSVRPGQFSGGAVSRPLPGGATPEREVPKADRAGGVSPGNRKEAR